MPILDTHYIDGLDVKAEKTSVFAMISPATEQQFGELVLGSTADVDLAVSSAKRALNSYRKTSKKDRIRLIRKIGVSFKKRMPELIDSVTEELGSPLKLSSTLQVPAGIMQVAKWTKVLSKFQFTEVHGGNQVLHEPIGVCALITSWNYPVNGIFGVLLPALAAGCTVVWKPSEYTSQTASILVSILHDAGVPKGVVNVVYGDGATVGHHLVTHDDVAMVSFTGSIETGLSISQTLATSLKRLVVELGGKSPYIVLEDANLKEAHRLHKHFITQHWANLHLAFKTIGACTATFSSRENCSGSCR
jgi:aldehyde dehydrogenase (NAD+)